MAAKLGIAALAKSVGATGKHGGNRKQDTKTENSILKKKQRTDTERRIAKLKRDHPAVAARLEAGEFKTVSAAERAAGSRSPLRAKEVITIYHDDIVAGLNSAVTALLPDYELAPTANAQLPDAMLEGASKPYSVRIPPQVKAYFFSRPELKSKIQKKVAALILSEVQADMRKGK